MSQFNHFFDNHFETHGNEGIDIKEGSTNNLVEDNSCTAQLDPASACEESVLWRRTKVHITAEFKWCPT